ncbi:MAG: diadenylate cyclase CdaA, partial [Candidatus Entotheonellia bacterium]
MAFLDYFRWQSVVDILLVSFLLYQLYLWVRESRALGAVAGLAVIGGLALLARWTGLIMASWLFESLWSIILLIIVIVFQPEIRRILERMNPLDFLWGQRVALRRETLAEITEAVFGMAREKVGALVVLPGQDPIEEHLREGIELEALVSRELLQTLFQPPAPTHDGAIVVRSNRIERAACFLPMTTATGIPSEYGARHRAAIGLTERCDALCLLVSEERGTVALARQGSLTPFFEPSRLQQELERELQDKLSSEALRAGRWARLTHNPWAKSLAVGLGLLLWVSLAGQQSSEIALTIPV